jgi:3-deoxy-D-manno-octulosonic-acid transferase
MPLPTLSLFFYNLLIYLLRFPTLLFFIWRSRADPAYRRRFAERFCYQQLPAEQAGGILLHAVSVGEVIAATPLIEQLLQQYPQLPLTVTCTTPTGSARLQAAFGDRIYHCYLPFDTLGANRRLLTKLAPQLLILLETELWPNLIRQAHAAAVPVLLVNARLSARSARGYRRFAALVKPMLNQLSFIGCQDNATLRRFRVLAGSAAMCDGQAVLVPPLQLSKTGNLKFDLTLNPQLQQQAALLKAQWGERPVWVAGSTHAGEDQQLLAAFSQILVEQPDTLFVLVPRHPDRFEAVASLVQQAGLSCVRRSENTVVQPQTQVLLGDTMGELMLWYQLADLVFVGGSLIERGGHNPLEPMSVHKAVLSGPHVFNFADIFKQMQRHDAVRFVQDSHSLATAVLQLLADPVVRQAQAARGAAIYQRHGGACQYLIAAVAVLIGTQPRCLHLRHANHALWYDPTLVQAGGFSCADPAFFQPRNWLDCDAVIGQSTGRNVVWFVQAKQQRWVLRHYYRGGLVGKLNRDWFWPVPLARSRAMAEFRLLQQLRQQGLPVPAPVAARMQRRGFGYSADILLQLVDGSTDLAKLLCQRALSAAEWQQVGQLIHRFHQAQLYHSDLNCHNILLDPKGQCWLIDFDKCGFRAGSSWQATMLARLERSLKKEQALALRRQQVFYWQGQDWQALLAGYQQATANSSEASVEAAAETIHPAAPGSL